MNKLSPVVVRVVEKNAEVLQEFGISELPQDLRHTATQALAAIVTSVQAKGDDNPADAEQIREIWYSFINRDATELLNDQATQLVNRIDSPEVRELLLYILPVVLNTLREVTDNEGDNNKEEIEKLWKALVGDPEFLTKIFGLIRLLF